MHTPKFVRIGETFSIFRPGNGDDLPVGTYVLEFNQQRGYVLSAAPDLQLPPKVYGDIHSDRIMTSYRHRCERGLPTGVWLNGEKGAGKTMLAAQLSKLGRADGMSTILVNHPYYGADFNEFVGFIGPCVFIFDEFEKVYDEDDNKNGVLTLFAGTVVSQHLFVLTTNTSASVVDAMRNRPSRMRYFIEYHGISESTAREYVTDNLIDTSKVDEIVLLLGKVPNCNFDIMQAVVEEHNCFGGDPMELAGIMNVSRRGPVPYTLKYEGYIDSDDYYTGPVPENVGPISEVTGTGYLYQDFDDCKEASNTYFNVTVAGQCHGKDGRWSDCIQWCAKHGDKITHGKDGTIVLTGNSCGKPYKLTATPAVGYSTERQAF